jgi:hypothetical protein
MDVLKDKDKLAQTGLKIIYRKIGDKIVPVGIENPNMSERDKQDILNRLKQQQEEEEIGQVYKNPNYNPAPVQYTSRNDSQAGFNYPSARMQ